MKLSSPEPRTKQALNKCESNLPRAEGPRPVWRVGAAEDHRTWRGHDVGDHPGHVPFRTARGAGPVPGTHLPLAGFLLRNFLEPPISAEAVGGCSYA